MKRAVKIVSTLVMGLFLSLGISMSVSAPDLLAGSFRYERVSQDQQVVHGFLDRVGSSIIVVDGYSYRVTPGVKVVDKEGNIIPEGVKGLVPQSEVKLFVEGRLVLQIQVMSLPR
jgi:hypothetical protein